MAAPPREFEPLSEENPWEDSDWIPSHAEILLPQDRLGVVMLETPVSTIAISDPGTIGPDASMSTALVRMRQRHIRALLVLEEERLVGIVTDRDAVRALDPGDSGAGITVREVMTPDPVTIGPDEPIGKAAQMLNLDGVHHLPIVEDDRVVGIVAMGRILHAIIEPLLAETD